MNINIANIPQDELREFCELLGVRVNNPSNIFYTPLTVERDGMFHHVGMIDFPVMTLNLEEIKKCL